MPRRSMLIVRVCMLAAAVAWVAGCATEEPRSRPQVGNVQLIDSNTDARVPHALVVELIFTNEGVQPGTQLIVDGAQQPGRSEEVDFRVNVVDRAGRVLSEYGLADPRKVIVERRGWVMMPQAVHAARFPLSKDAAAVRLFDARGQLLARADVEPIVTTFCREHPRVKGC